LALENVVFPTEEELITDFYCSPPILKAWTVGMLPVDPELKAGSELLLSNLEASDEVGPYDEGIELLKILLDCWMIF